MVAAQLVMQACSEIMVGAKTILTEPMNRHDIFLAAIVVVVLALTEVFDNGDLHDSAGLPNTALDVGLAIVLLVALRHIGRRSGREERP